jgi:hypothetical protein
LSGHCVDLLTAHPVPAGSTVTVPKSKSVVWWLKSKISLCGKMLRKISLPHFFEILDFFLTPQPESNGSLWLFTIFEQRRVLMQAWADYLDSLKMN